MNTVKNEIGHPAELSFGAMEYFLLALIGKASLTSLYALQQRAGLQPGGIRPALKRLYARGFIARAESSARQRRDLSLTARGLAFLNDTWKQSLSEYPDNESVFRAVCVALLMGNAEYATLYLEGMSVGRRNSAQEKSMEAERLGKIQRDPLSTYAWMRVLSEARRRGAETEALSTASQFLKEQLQPDGGFQP
jgi:DNA-binding MarR family transcriptional regulator